MNITASIRRADRLQQKHTVLGFVFAVIKKYGDDSGGFQAALITYYGFLSLFPLLLVLLTILQLWFENNPQLRADVATSVSHYFPLLATQLQANIHAMGRTGASLVIGLLFTLYGARGAADALRYTLNNVWQIPQSDRSGFPKNKLQSIGIIGCGALGFAATVGVSAFSSSLGHALWVKVLANICGFVLVSAILSLVFWAATAGRLPFRFTFTGAMVAAGCIQMLLTFGSLLVAHQLKTMDSLYGTFAIVLGLIFWLYLLAQIVVYAAEADAVRHLKLWPRSITPELQTEADRRAYQLHAATGRLIKEEHIRIGLRHRSKKVGRS